MHRNTKSATCCYCGAETLLTFTKSTRHELRCAACGAPISKLKSLKSDHVADAYTVRGKKQHQPFQPQHPKLEKKNRKKKKKKRGLSYYLMEAAEEVFDIFD